MGVPPHDGLSAWHGSFGCSLCDKNARYVGVVVQWDRMPVSDAGDEGSSPSCAVGYGRCRNRGNKLI